MSLLLICWVLRFPFSFHSSNTLSKLILSLTLKACSKTCERCSLPVANDGHPLIPPSWQNRSSLTCRFFAYLHFQCLPLNQCNLFPSFPSRSYQNLVDLVTKTLFFIEKAFWVKAVTSPLRHFLCFSFIIINLFFKRARNYHPFYLFLARANMSWMCRIPARNNHELAL